METVELFVYMSSLGICKGFIPGPLCGYQNPWMPKCLVSDATIFAYNLYVQPTLVFLPRESHGQRSLAGYSPWDHKRVGHDWATKHTLDPFTITFDNILWTALLQNHSPRHLHPQETFLKTNYRCFSFPEKHPNAYYFSNVESHAMRIVFLALD